MNFFVNSLSILYGDRTQLPKEIFLNFKSSYSFTVELTPAQGVNIENLEIGFQLSGHDYVRVSHIRSLTSQGTIMYYVMF